MSHISDSLNPWRSPVDVTQTSPTELAGAPTGFVAPRRGREPRCHASFFKLSVSSFRKRSGTRSSDVGDDRKETVTEETDVGGNRG